MQCGVTSQQAVANFAAGALGAHWGTLGHIGAHFRSNLRSIVSAGAH
jgi:hypothetical protein